MSLKGKERASGPGKGLQHKVDPLFGPDIGPLDGTFYYRLTKLSVH